MLVGVKRLPLGIAVGMHLIWYKNIWMCEVNLDLYVLMIEEIE